MDAYVIGVFKPLETFTGRCIAVIQRSDDDDDKLVVAPDGKDYSDEQILALTEFQERFFESSVTREAGRGERSLAPTIRRLSASVGGLSHE